MSADIIPIRERIDVTDWPILAMAEYAHNNGWRDMRVIVDGDMREGAEPTIYMERVR